jgi:hypothetical protein
VGLVGALALTVVAFAAAGVSWGTAIEVPGTAALAGAGGGAVVFSVSCASTGNCAAGGAYGGASTGVQQAFLVDEKSGVWGKAIEVPGTAALNVASPGAQVNSVSCASAGNCAAGGQYADSSGNHQAFLVDEKSGVWGNAVEVPGTAALDLGGGGADVFSVSCASAGNCAAGGWYIDSTDTRQAFVVDEKNGVWGTAIEVPGTAALNAAVRDSGAALYSVSCRRAGDCSAGGDYENASFEGQAFVVDEKNGVWGNAREVRGSRTFNTNFAAHVAAVSCASVGNCTAGGFFTPRHNTPLRGRQTAFVVNEKNGVWGKASGVSIDGIEPWPAGVSSVSCASAGNCAAGGVFGNVSFGWHAFVVAEKNGHWRTAVVVPGTPRSISITPLSDAAVTSISCASARHCAVGGYTNHRGRRHIEAFFETEQSNGAWGKAVPVPGTAALSVGYTRVAEVTSVSCARKGKCVAGGFYGDASANGQAFVTTP